MRSVPNASAFAVYSGVSQDTATWLWAARLQISSGCASRTMRIRLVASVRSSDRAYKRLSGNMTWDAARSDWHVQVYWDQRDYLQAGQAEDSFSKDEDYAGIAAGTRWQAFARTRLDFDVNWYSRNLAQGDVRTVDLSLAAVRQLTPQLEARLAGSWSDQSADTGTLSEFEAATAFLGIVWRR
jgi:hypothetical protein